MKLFFSTYIILMITPYLTRPFFSEKNKTVDAIKNRSTINYHPHSVKNDTNKVHFIATNLILFDQQKIHVTNETININLLLRKKDRALILLDSVVNSTEFKSKVLSRHFTHKNNMTNLQIYNLFVSNDSKILNIREHLTLSIDTSTEMNINKQKGKTKSIGYDNKRGDSIVHTVQIQIVKFMSAQAYAAHIAHEYSHMIGFTHPWPGKWDGVPYGIQNIIEDMLVIPQSRAY